MKGLFFYNQYVPMYQKIKIFVLAVFIIAGAYATAINVRHVYNFNPSWKVFVGENSAASEKGFDDSNWKSVSLPYAWNEDAAFKVAIHDLPTGIAWYRKHFKLPPSSKNKKVFLEFEGVRQAAQIWINGTKTGIYEDGISAFGIDITPYVISGSDNVIAVRTDNSWGYKEAATGSTFQWNDKNFYANYGGIGKNVKLHVCDKIYQTLPLYSSLHTTGVYLYANQFDIPKRRATLNVASEIKNETARPESVRLKVTVADRSGKTIKSFSGQPIVVQPGKLVVANAAAPLDSLHFWSWGYGYLYTINTILVIDNKEQDLVSTNFGFRKTHFGNGMVELNDRTIQLKGYAQRSTNEWPAVGTDIPAWVSDFSNGMMVESNANLVRWMHVTPWKQDVESCDRVGLIQAMPAGDSEKDVDGRRWEHRLEVMRNAIIYNRNNPSILFYESGNKGISEEHMLQMKAIRDLYDPHGGRVIGSREMLDSKSSEYGGEMLYINKSARQPVWAMEYCRDEALRKYWDEQSYPYHKEGAGPLYKGANASDYNHNQDQFAIEDIRRWDDYYIARPGTGKRVSSGGVNIVFADSNTHFRGEENYRRSGEVDAMRIPKDAFYAHQAMWDGWVDLEKFHTYIIGHWNYADTIVKDISVVSAAPQIELFLNGRSLGVQTAKDAQYDFLHIFPKIKFEKGTLLAISKDAAGKEQSRYSVQTAGAPRQITLKPILNPKGWRADGSDLALIEVEVKDKNGIRCPLANDTIRFSVTGPAEWRGGIAQGKDNFILSQSIPVECGINRVFLRSLPQSGKVQIVASSNNLLPAEITLTTQHVAVNEGLSELAPLPDGALRRGETPTGKSYSTKRIALEVESAAAGANQEMAENSYDDNEMTEWRNDGKISTGWITYTLKRDAVVSEVVMKLTGWRSRSYPLTVSIDGKEVWKGSTPRSLGYVTLPIAPTKGKTITIRLTGDSKEKDAFENMIEVTGTKQLDLYNDPNAANSKGQLRIVEIEFYKTPKSNTTD
ncbi:hypothetical protein PJIAN_1927 [Paludibacter jiangxiensis]|uniref:Beta-galactosidase n=2 Tax=Paludibacter jiangxiensis TaxID=681398 RepID=A0A170Z520_9BACT|nr:hypothetical protein PJIAN_1927 [Paludibacter jiangxiensis]